MHLYDCFLLCCNSACSFKEKQKGTLLCRRNLGWLLNLRLRSGFCPGQGMVDQIFTFVRILGETWELSHPVSMRFVDLGTNICLPQDTESCWDYCKPCGPFRATMTVGSAAFPTHGLYLGGPARYINGRQSIFGEPFLYYLFIHPREWRHMRSRIGTACLSMSYLCP